MNTYLCRGICALMICASGYLSAEDLLPPPTGKPLKTFPEIVNCFPKGCALSGKQLSAITLATHLYRGDMPKVDRFHVEVVNDSGTIQVTVMPDYVGDIPPYSVPGDKMAVTYIFDSSGAVLKDKYFNR